MITGDPDALEAAAAALARTPGFGDAANGIDLAASLALSRWEGQAAAAAGATFARFRPALTAGDNACRAVVPALRAYAAELRSAQEQFAAAPDPDVVERVRIADERAAAAVARAQDQLAAMRVTTTAPQPITAPPDDDPGLLNTLGHTALDVVGLVPIVGEAADVANAAWYALEGDHLAAGLSLAAAIPLAGWAFTGGKLGIKGADTVKAVTDTGSAAAWVKGRPSMVPWNAQRMPYKGVGEQFRWIDTKTGKTVTYHGHPTSSIAPAGSNSASGPTYRIKVGNHHVDAEGKSYTRKQLDERSPAYDPQGANDTHIPYPTNQPLGWDPGRRVFVPNATSLTDGTGGENQSTR